MVNSSQFILGFIAGEGSFCLSIQRRADTKTGYDLTPSFRMGIKDVDRELLENIQEEIPVNCSIYESGNELQLYIGGMQKLLNFIEWIEEKSQMFKKSEKYRSMQQMKEIVQKMQNGLHHKPEGLIEIAEIREEMNSGGHGKRISPDEIRESIQT